MRGKKARFLRNKRGTLFALYMVALTLIMCGIVIAIYYVQAKGADSMLVSPTQVLQLQDKQQLFEMWEKNLILNDMKEAQGHSDAALKDIFCIDFADPAQGNIGDFLISGTDKEAFCNQIYTFKSDSDGLTVSRTAVTKSFTLKVSDKSKINYPVTVEYSYSKTWRCTLADCE